MRNLNIWEKSCRTSKRLMGKRCSCVWHVPIGGWWGAAPRPAARRAPFAVCFVAVWVYAVTGVQWTTSNLRLSHFTTTLPVFFYIMKYL